MKLPWRRAQAEPVDSRRAVSSSKSKALELQAAKEILAEVFGTRPGEVEEMIQRRLEESETGEDIWPEEREEGLWPATFYLGE